MLVNEEDPVNCVNAFDDDGECTYDWLPFSDVTEFAQLVEELGDNWELDGVVCVYCSTTDIHTFFQV